MTSYNIAIDHEYLEFIYRRLTQACVYYVFKKKNIAQLRD